LKSKSLYSPINQNNVKLVKAMENKIDHLGNIRYDQIYSAKSKNNSNEGKQKSNMLNNT